MKITRAMEAGEFMKLLEADPEYQERSRATEERRRVLAEEIAAVEAPMFRELEREGIHITDVQQLFRSKTQYFASVPVLVKWLRLIENARVKEGIVRTLSIRGVGPDVARLLIAEYKRAPAEHGSLKWAIGNALELIADDTLFSELVELVLDKHPGSKRDMVAAALGKTKKNADRAVQVLLELLGDEELAVKRGALTGLGRLKCPSTRRAIAPFLNDANPVLRTEAKRAIAKIDRAVAKLESPKKTKAK